MLGLFQILTKDYWYFTIEINIMRDDSYLILLIKMITFLVFRKMINFFFDQKYAFGFEISVIQYIFGSNKTKQKILKLYEFN